MPKPAARAAGARAELRGVRHRDRVLVVLHEEDHRRVEDGGEVEGLADVALAGGPVAEADEDDLVGAVERHAHRVPRRLQRLRAHDEREQAEVEGVDVPGGVGDAAHDLQDRDRVDSAVHPHGELAVRGVDHVGRPQRRDRADLGGLLALRRRPQGELPLALQVGALDVDASGEEHRAVRVANLVGRELRAVRGVADFAAFGIQELYGLDAVSRQAAGYVIGMLTGVADDSWGSKRSSRSRVSLPTVP